MKPNTFGEVAEWSKAPVSKTGRRESVSRVQIPPSPFELFEKGVPHHKIARERKLEKNEALENPFF